MMFRIVRWLLVLAIFLSIGLQWAVLQGAAWVGMIVSYSKEATISQALTIAFDGSHPCKLCRAAQNGESTQKKQNADNPPVKFVLAAPEHDEFHFEPEAKSEAVLVASVAGRRMVRPTVPPPRLV